MTTRRIATAAALLFVTSPGCTFWRHVDVTTPAAVQPTDTVRLWYRGGYQELNQVHAAGDSIVGRRVSDSTRIVVARAAIDSAKVGRGPGASGVLLGVMGGALALLIYGFTQMGG